MSPMGILEKLGFTLEQMVRCRTNSVAHVYIPARVNGQAVQLIFSTGAPVSCFLYRELSAFGRTMNDVRAGVGSEYRGGDPPIAGYLDGAFLKDGIVAIDPPVPAMAFTTTREQVSLTGAVSRLAFNGNCVAIDGKTFAISYQLNSSIAGQHGRADLTLHLPGGVTVTQSVEVRAYKHNIDGILGADLLCQWITVFDFPTRELLLFPYD
jgi:hypothetical protein